MPQYVLEGPKWASNTVSWSFATNLPGAAAGFFVSMAAAYQDTVRQAFAQWASVSGLRFNEVADGAAANIRVGFGPLQTPSTGTIGSTNYGSNPVTNSMTAAAVRLEDPSETPVAATAGGYVYQAYGVTMLQVALHEIGHALGLDHSPDPASIMNATASSADSHLDATDIAGIQALYGAPAASPVPAPTPVPMPTPIAVAPAPVAPSTPAPATALVLHVSEDAWQGDAQFTISIDGKQVGGVQTVTALHGAGQSQAIMLDGNLGTGTHQVAVSFINDAWGGTAATDRNLYVDGIDYHGTAVAGAKAGLFSNGAATFAVSDAAAAPAPVAPVTPVASAPASSALVLHLSEDAWQGDAQFTVSVDGKQVGGVQTVTALHGAGQTEDFTVSGSFGAGPHAVGISFINDAWGGTAVTDRNLYLDGVEFGGSAVAGGKAALYSNGTTTISTPGTTSAAAVTTAGITVNLSEDAWRGDAQAVVSIDGKQQGGVQTITASHGLGQSQAIGFLVPADGAAHAVSVSFLNDAWGGTAATDRNLYWDSVDVAGAHQQVGASLFSNGTASFSVTAPAAAGATGLLSIDHGSAHALVLPA